MPGPLDRLKDRLVPAQLSLSTFLIVLGALLITRWQVLVQYTFQADDYHQITYGILPEQLLAQGRYGSYLLQEIARFSGVSPISAPIITIGLSCVLAAWIAVRMIHEWLPDVSRMAVVLAALLMMAHPYTAELFGFRGVTLFHYIAYTASTAALLLTLRVSYLENSLAVFLLTFSIGVYQISLNFYLVLLVFSILIKINLAYRSKKDCLEWVRGAIATSFIVSILSLIIHMALAHITRPKTFNDNRSRFIGIEQVPDRVFEFFTILRKHFIDESAYAGQLLSNFAVYSLFYFTVITFSFLLITAVGRKKINVFVPISSIFLVFAAMLFLVGVLLVSERLWLPPRVFMPIGIIWAGAFLLAHLWSGPHLRYLSTSLAAITVLGFISINQQVFVDHWRVNLRDRAIAINWIKELSENPQWANVETIVVQGGRWNFGSPIRTIAGNQNTSAFASPWAIAPLFSETTGRNFRRPKASEANRARKFCENVPNDMTSTRFAISNKSAIICIRGDK